METVKVASERCETCIFRERYPKETRERIIGGTDNDDLKFIACHQHEIEDDDGAIQQDVVCRGYYNRNPYLNVLLRVAHALCKVEFVDERGVPVSCPWPQGRAGRGCEG